VEEAHTSDEKAGLHLCRRHAPGGNGWTSGLSGAADHGTERGLRCALVRVRLGKVWSLGTAHEPPVAGSPRRARTVAHGEAQRAGSRSGARERGRRRGALKHLAVALFD
jgi:hypothetical protein